MHKELARLSILIHLHHFLILSLLFLCDSNHTRYVATRPPFHQHIRGERRGGGLGRSDELYTSLKDNINWPEREVIRR